jgi:hypothetical protein
MCEPGPEGYEFTDEDRERVKTFFASDEAKDPLSVVGQGSAVIDAIAPLRAALIEYHMPIHGQRCQNWPKFAHRFKAVIADF